MAFRSSDGEADFLGVVYCSGPDRGLHASAGLVVDCYDSDTLPELVDCLSLDLVRLKRKKPPMRRLLSIYSAIKLCWSRDSLRRSCERRTYRRAPNRRCTRWRRRWGDPARRRGTHRAPRLRFP